MAGETGERAPLDLLVITRVDSYDELPDGLTRERLGEFLHESLKPYEDPYPVILDGLDYALGSDPCKDGFVILGRSENRLLGAVVMLDTGMSRYVPENLLLFIAVDPDARGQGIGGALLQRVFEECEGQVKLHVEHDNPARHLYERSGFKSKYLEMRWEGE
ncbi:MAG: GNAT family N-acetyltransferase [Candidatus Eisenbacteria bacterium]|nr:GNAT family N-acetyltransferase [Candidatus Eisenbacteria bacterium]